MSSSSSSSLFPKSLSSRLASSSQSSASRSTSTENQRQTSSLNNFPLTRVARPNSTHIWLDACMTNAKQGLQAAGQYAWDGFINLAVFVAEVQIKQKEYDELRNTQGVPAKKLAFAGRIRQITSKKIIREIFKKENLNCILNTGIVYIANNLPLGSRGLVHVTLSRLTNRLMNFYPENKKITTRQATAKPLDTSSNDDLVRSPAIRATGTLAIEEIPNGFATSSLQGVTNSLSESLQETTLPELLQVFVANNIPNYQLALQTENLQSLQQAKEIIQEKIATLTSGRHNESNTPKLFSLNTLVKGLKNTPSNLQILFEKSKLTLINLKLKAISNQQHNSIIKNILTFLNTQRSIDLNSKPGKRLLKIAKEFSQLQSNKQDTRSGQVLIKKAGRCLKKLSIEDKNNPQKTKSNSPILNATSKLKGLQSIRTFLSNRASSYDSSNSSELGLQDEEIKDLLQKDKAILLNLFMNSAPASQTNQASSSEITPADDNF